MTTRNPLDLRVNATGGWGTETKTNETRLTIRVEDPTSGTMLMELTLDQDAVLKILSNRGNTDVNARLRVWPMDRVGKHHQRVELHLRVKGTGDEALMRAITDAHKILGPHGFLISNYDMKWNGHRWSAGTYRIPAARYVDSPETPIPDEVKALMAPTLEVVRTPPRRKAPAAKNGKGKSGKAKTATRPEVFRAE